MMETADYYLAMDEAEAFDLMCSTIDAQRDVIRQLQEHIAELTSGSMSRHPSMHIVVKR